MKKLKKIVKIDPHIPEDQSFWAHKLSYSDYVSLSRKIDIIIDRLNKNNKQLRTILAQVVDELYDYGHIMSYERAKLMIKKIEKL